MGVCFSLFEGQIPEEWLKIRSKNSSLVEIKNCLWVGRFVESELRVRMRKNRTQRNRIVFERPKQPTHVVTIASLGSELKFESRI